MANIDKLRPEDLNCNIFSCYDYDGLSLQELLCQFFNKINEIVEVADRTVDLAEWLVNEGLAEEVAKTLDKWKDDGTLKKIINEEIFNELNNKVEFIRQSTEQPANIIKDPYINDYRQQLTAGDNTEHYNVGTYGKCELHVKNGVGKITGYLNFTKTPDSGVDFTMIKPDVELKQIQTMVTNTVGFNKSNLSESANLPLYLGKNGTAAIDGDTWVAGNNKYRTAYISMNMTFPIVKAYAKDSEKNIIDAKVIEVNKLKNAKTSTVVVACDTHIRPTMSEDTNSIEDYDIYLPKLLNYTNTKVGAFATIINGDNVTEAPNIVTKEQIFRLYDQVRKMYNDNTLFVLGNHDDMSIQTIQAQYNPSTIEYNNSLNQGKTGIVFSEGGHCYYYADDTAGMCRHIILDSHDGPGKKIGLFKFGANQMKWLVRTLTTMANGYSALLFHHCPVYEGHTDIVENSTQFKKILSDYNKRVKGKVYVDGTEVAYDFTACEGLIAGAIAGHEHVDDNKVIDGVNYIIEASSKGYTEHAPEKFAHTIIQVDGKNRKLRLHRLFGGGARKSLELNY